MTVTWDEVAAVIDLAAPVLSPSVTDKNPAINFRAASKLPAAALATRESGKAHHRNPATAGRSARTDLPPAGVPRPARPRLVPLTPMRHQTAKSLRRLAAAVQGTHPEMAVHDHLRDAARVLEAGNEEGAQRHLRAAIGSLTPQALYRHGISTDDGHIQGKQAMAGVHRHLLLVKDIMDAGEKNRAAIARHAGGDDTAPPPPPVSPAHPDPNAGYGPGALAQKPTARQPGGGRALNAPDRTSSGGPDPAAADPQGPQPGGSKQMARTWDELADVIDLAWIASPSKAEWAAIDAKSGHSVPDAKDGSDEDKADAHIRFARQATNIGQHDVAMKHLARASALTSDPGKQAAVNTLRGAVAKNAALRGQSQQLIGLSAETGRLAVTPAPYGKPGGPGLYGVKGLKHSDYLEQVVQALMRRGMDKGKATAIARGSIRRWMAKSKHPEVRAAAGLAETQEIAAQARAHAHATTWDDLSAVVVDLASQPAAAKSASASAQPRVPAGQAGGGQFGTAAQGAKSPAKAPAKEKTPAKGKPAPPKQGQQKQTLAQAKQNLLNQAAAKKQQAAAIQKNITDTQKIIAAAQAGTGKTASTSNATSAQAGATTSTAGSTTASTASTPGTSSSSSTSSTSGSTAAAITQMQGQVSAWQGQVKTLLAQAAALTTLAGKMGS